MQTPQRAAAASELRLVNPILFVDNIEISMSFYKDVLGFAPAEITSNFVRFDSGFALHEGSSLASSVWGTDQGHPKWFGCRNLLMYFEHDAIDELYERTHRMLDVIHPIAAQPWGQRVFRFYDPDRHAIEVGEPYRTPIGLPLSVQNNPLSATQEMARQIS